MTKVDLKEAIRELAQDTGSVFSQASESRKQADALLQKLHALEDNYIRQFEEEKQRQKREEQQRAISAQSRAYTTESGFDSGLEQRVVSEPPVREEKPAPAPVAEPVEAAVKPAPAVEKQPEAPAPVPAPVAAPAPKAAPAAAPKAAAAAPAGAEAIKAPMPGNINAVKVSQGQNVKKGDVLLILEAMKMENEIMAPRDGVVASVNVSKGATVNTGDVLLSLN